MGLIARIKDYLFDRRNVIEIESLEVDGNTVPLDELINKNLYYHKIDFTFVFQAQTKLLRLNVLTNIKDKFDSYIKMSDVFASLYNGGFILTNDDKIIFSTTHAINIVNCVPQTVSTKYSFIGNNGMQFTLIASQNGYQIRIYDESSIDLTTGKMKNRTLTTYSLTLVSEEVKEIIL